MKLLILDTSSICQAAVVDDGHILALEQLDSMKYHAEYIVSLAQKVLHKSDITKPDAVVVGTGPGPFTGLRAAISAGSVIAYAWDIPVYGLMSHYGFSHKGEYLTLSDARRKEVYWCHFKDQQLLDGPHVSKRESLPDFPTIGFEAEPYYMNAGILGLRAQEFLEQGVELSSIEPYYLREADAKVPGPRKRVIS
ncbi:MAG: tRNA (adenosine(37)-N6)-threonylcarbamoyltransferase complex dimerization subunit type 1 TsaB [Micrococcaceae bacterium]